ncbi:MAG: hypothetical protein KME60_29745 [Cyanomargarita calcarea GSE-NOS-MK-12-04C]|uniref:Uncharacterized protein n=1 Tax=Cyanomargarita calcarea GSE-NOS-MK-12-04C TaxID=2839659 RepID=A0A951QST7_9CYAN|nr:hypothetical protein [Cyanomargarita calcarea GSE-NOS-MK-12-04C]
MYQKIITYSWYRRRKKEEGRRKKEEVYICGYRTQLKTSDLFLVFVLNPHKEADKNKSQNPEQITKSFFSEFSSEINLIIGKDIYIIVRDDFYELR